MVQNYLNSDVNEGVLNEIQANQKRRYNFDFKNNVSDYEVEELLGELRGQFDQQKFDALINSCKQNVLENIIRPFGLAKVLFTHDQDGGNVLTEKTYKDMREARKSGQYIERNNKDHEKKINRRSGTKSPKGDSRIECMGDNAKARKLYNQRKKDVLGSKETITDAYTGKRIPVTEKNGSKIPLDHVTSVKEVIDEHGLFYDNDEIAEIAYNDDNLIPTSSEINNKKKDASVDELLNDDKKLQKLKNMGFDPDRAKKLDEKSRKSIQERTKDRNIRKVKQYSKDVVITGAKEGFRMGTQQAIGLLLQELVESTFSEIKDIYSNGFVNGEMDKKFFNILKKRMKRIAKKVLQKWQHVVKSFGEGVISGFISNFITFVINTFSSTCKRVVRIIREGIFSLLKAIKILIFPPAGMTIQQAAHEASKLIASGVVIAGGIALEEAISGPALVGFLGPLAPLANPIILVSIGLVTGLSTIFVVYMLDKMDLFGVNQTEKHENIISKLENMISSSVQKAEEAFQIFEPPKLLHV